MVFTEAPLSRIEIQDQTTVRPITVVMFLAVSRLSVKCAWRVCGKCRRVLMNPRLGDVSGTGDDLFPAALYLKRYWNFIGHAHSSHSRACQEA